MWTQSALSVLHSPSSVDEGFPWLWAKSLLSITISALQGIGQGGGVGVVEVGRSSKGSGVGGFVALGGEPMPLEMLPSLLQLAQGSMSGQVDHTIYTLSTFKKNQSITLQKPVTQFLPPHLRGANHSGR